MSAAECDLLLVGDGKAAGADAGIVERDIELAIRRDGALHHAAAIGFAAYVSGDGQGVAASLFDEGYGLLGVRLILIDRHNARSLGGKELRGRPADSRTGTCNQNAAIDKTAGHPSLHSSCCKVGAVQDFGILPQRVRLA